MHTLIRRALRTALAEASRLTSRRRRHEDPKPAIPGVLATAEDRAVFCTCGRHIPDGAYVSFLIIPDDIANAIRDRIASARVEVVDGVPVYVTCVGCASADHRDIMGQLKEGKILRVNQGMFERYRAKVLGKS